MASKQIKEKKYWLLKSEASCYSIDDFANDKKTQWTGVRNYQARNFMKSSGFEVRVVKSKFSFVKEKISEKTTIFDFE